jgi:hypothetical protein
MNITRQDDLLRYLVESRSRAGVTYVVELDLYELNGGCTCEHFNFRLEPMLKKGVTDAKNTDALRCAHIVAARRKLVDDIIAQVARNRDAPAPRQRAERAHPARYSGKARKTKQRGAQKRR